jgi:gluconolactonase
MGTVDALYDAGSLRQLATGFEFTEGPVWHPDGYWLCVDLRASQIWRVTTDGQRELIREGTNGGNGMTRDRQGRLVLCEGKNRRITRQEPSGEWTVLADRWQGARFHRPNDVVGASDGSLYFTDNGRVVEADEREMLQDGVYQIHPDGSLSTVTGAMNAPNGLAFSPDEQTLYVANTKPGYLAAFHRRPDGSWSHLQPFAEMPGGEAGKGVPDGMKVDVEGRVYCTGPGGGIWVFSPEGEQLGTILGLPEVPANLAWGGQDRRTLLLTARTSLYTLRMATPGTPIP